MAKKCIPGVICIENMTFAILFIVLFILAYAYYTLFVKMNPTVNQYTLTSSIPITSSISSIPITSHMSSSAAIALPMSTRTSPNVILDPYGPPFRTDGMYFSHGPVTRGIPVNIETRGLSMDYSQMGILTRNNGTDMILPLMGRRLLSGLDKWQYYTISNSGNMNTKLPISLKGRSCSGEYGCDCINTGDLVFVEGYNDTFKVSVYETSRFNYIPYI